MAEEHTMSGITYVNSVLCALQSISMVTNQVKVCQWYSFDPKVWDSSKISMYYLWWIVLGICKAANIPQMNFVSLKKYMWCSLINADQDSDDDNDDSERNANVTLGRVVQDAEIDPVESIMTIFEQLDLNVDSKVLAKLLTDNPEQPGASILLDRLAKTQVPDTISENDRGEYSMGIHLICNFFVTLCTSQLSS